MATDTGTHYMTEIAERETLPACYGGVPPTETYDTPADLRSLRFARKRAEQLRAHFHGRLLLFGPKPSIQSASWEEDMAILVRNLDWHIAQVQRAMKAKRRS